MIDKEIKRKIKSKEESSNNNFQITSSDLYHFFSSAPATIDKGLFKNFRQKRMEKNCLDTRQYLLDNFDIVLGRISEHELADFLTMFSFCSNQKDLMQKLSDNKMVISELMNPSSQSILSHTFSHVLRTSKFAHIFFENDFKTFYTNTNRFQFNPADLLVMNLTDEKVEPLLLETMCDCIDDDSLRPEDTVWFLEKYINLASRNENVLCNELRIHSSNMSKETKSKIQEKITPERALALMQLTDKPLLLKGHLESADLITPEISEYLDTHLDDIVSEISSNSHDQDIIKQVVQELLEHEQAKPSDIKYLSKGGYSHVFKIGEKILKYGKRPRTPEIAHNSEFFLQPLLRTSLNGSDSLEVYEEVNVGATQEEMYQLYKSLREQGLTWTDIKPDNVGHLKKDNSIHFDGIESVAHNAVGFKVDRDIPLRKAGEVVLIDLDFVFAEDEKVVIPSQGNSSYFFDKFTSRYQKEKEAENNPTQTQIKNPQTDFGEI